MARGSAAGGAGDWPEAQNHLHTFQTEFECLAKSSPQPRVTNLH